MQNPAETFGLQRCTDCLACTEVCPFGESMETPPAAIVRHAATGDVQTLLQAPDIWLCSSCGACTRACPVGIDVEGLLEALRRQAAASGPNTATIARYHNLFVKEARDIGRVREGRVLLAMRFRYGGPFPRGGLTPALLVKGKIGKVLGRPPKETS